MYCHTKRVRKIQRDKNFKTTPWQSLPTCLKQTLKLEKLEKSNITCLIICPHTQPSAAAQVSALVVSALSSDLDKHCQLHFINGQQPQALLEMAWTPSDAWNTNLPSKIPASVTQDFWDWFSDWQPRAAFCTAKYVRARNKNRPPRKTQTKNKEKHFEIAISGYL